MKLDVIIDSKNHRIDVPQEMLDEGEEFFRKMDRDMDGGWQMGPEFVESPDPAQRCQIAANKLLISVSAQNQLLVQLMAAYILRRMPNIKAVEIDTTGEMLNTELVFDDQTPTPARPSPTNRPMNASDMRNRVDGDVSQVYKVGRAYRFATYDHTTGRWVESPFAATEEEAKKLREAACTLLIGKRTQG